jgi:hypothetical protein
MLRESNNRKRVTEGKIQYSHPLALFSHGRGHHHDHDHDAD